MYKYGLIGLATMGQNLARNFANKGIPIAVYNRTVEKTRRFIEEFGNNNLAGYDSFEEFVKSIERPRKIIVLVKASAVDRVREQLMGVLDPGDIVIDGGNSHYARTQRRSEEVDGAGFHWVGMGISGGAEGALNGPSLMLGGDKEIIQNLLPDLSMIAADDFQDGKTVSYFGPDGAGHFVKMVHNGIEYAIMQAMAEVYDYMKYAEGRSNRDIAETFTRWVQSDLRSFLLEITVDILKTTDHQTGSDLIDMIVDEAGDKGTGKWAAEAALRYGIPTPTINEALFARYMSLHRDHRIRLSQEIQYDVAEVDTYVDDGTLAQLFYATSLLAFYQGFQLISQASKEFGWGVNLSEVCRVWQGGCIIRANYLKDLAEIYRSGQDPLLTDFYKKHLDIRIQANHSLHRFVQSNIPTPVISASYQYYLSIIRDRLPTNLIQAQRDYFGQHTYKRVDKEGVFSGGWE